MRRCRPHAALLLPLALFGQSAPRNLGFDEGAPGKRPPRWMLAQGLAKLGYSAEVRSEGCKSGPGCVWLSVRAAAAASGNLGQRFDASEYRGRSFRLTAWLRLDSATPAKRAELWIRIDNRYGTPVFSENTDHRPVTSKEWTQAGISGVVPGDAANITIGIRWFGNGSIWADSVEFESSAPGTETAAVREAVDQFYRRLDAAYASGDTTGIASLLAARATQTSGSTRVPLAGVFRSIRDDIRAGARFTSKSAVISVRTSLDGAIVTVRQERMRKSAEDSRTTIYTNRDTWTNGPFGWRLADSAVRPTGVVAGPLDAQGAAEVTAELKARSVALMPDGTGPAEFTKAVGDARVVALGEPTSGSREVFRAKAALFRQLVEAKGFTVLAVESSWPDCEGVDRYVRTGELNPDITLTGMNLWPWYSREAADLLEWMRSRNGSRGGSPLRVACFDAAQSGPAGERALAYLARYSPADAAYATLAYTQAESFEKSLGRTTEASGEAAVKALKKVLNVFDQKHAALVKASSQPEWNEARHAAAVAFQACASRLAGQDPSFREQAMASNVAWIADNEFPNAKVVVWSSNRHARSGLETQALGAFLRQRFGGAYYSLGIAIRSGRTRAMRAVNNRLTSLDTINVPPSPEGSGDTILSAGGPSYFLDIKAIPVDSVLGRWLAQPHLFYDFGPVWDSDLAESNLYAETLATCYDSLLFIDTVSPSTWLAKGNP